MQSTEFVKDCSICIRKYDSASICYTQTETRLWNNQQNRSLSRFRVWNIDNTKWCLVCRSTLRWSQRPADEGVPLPITTGVPVHKEQVPRVSLFLICRRPCRCAEFSTGVRSTAAPAAGCRRKWRSHNVVDIYQRAARRGTNHRCSGGFVRLWDSHVMFIIIFTPDSSHVYPSAAFDSERDSLGAQVPGTPVVWYIVEGFRDENRVENLGHCKPITRRRSCRVSAQPTPLYVRFLCRCLWLMRIAYPTL